MAEEKQKCPHCDGTFTKKGLSGHIAFKHKGGSVGGTKEAPGAQRTASTSTSGERKPAERSELDKFLFD